MNFKGRIEKILNLISEKELDGAIIVGGSNIFYLSGTDAASALIIGPREKILLCPRLEALRAQDEEKIGARVIGYTEADVEFLEDEDLIKGSFSEALIKALEIAGLKAEKTGITKEKVSTKTLQKLEKTYGTVKPIDEILKQMRRVKDSDEVEAITKASRLAEKALRKALYSMEKGVTEGELAGIILHEIYRAGAEPSFPPIVAFAEHSAHPHAKPGNKKLERGDLVKIDLGARVEGYCSDMTRTLVFGEASEKQRQLLKAVLSSQQAALEALRVGVKGKAVDEKAREVLRKKGLAKYFNHGLGHGVGVDIHEPPTLSPSSKDSLLEGEVFTVEPGIYIKGFGGIRIEDTVVLTSEGYKPLTRFERELW